MGQIGYHKVKTLWEGPKIWKILHQRFDVFSVISNIRGKCVAFQHYHNSTLLVAQKTIVGFQFPAYFCNPCIKTQVYTPWKLVSNVRKTFCGYPWHQKSTKGQLISEWIYEVIFSPKIWTQNLWISALYTEILTIFGSYFGRKFILKFTDL